MTITIPDDKARDLLADLPASTTAAMTELKEKLKEGLDRSRNLTADELNLVLAVLDGAGVHQVQVIAEAVSIDPVRGLHLFRSAQSKLRTIHSRTLAREQGRG